MIWGYTAALIAGAGGLGLALWNGLERGHWEPVGSAAVVIACPNMAILLRKERRKPLA
jgi:ABC-type phosphate/phosphonate transport system permease subunit